MFEVAYVPSLQNKVEKNTTVDEKELLKERAHDEHGHSHDNDIPSRAIKLFFSLGTLVYYLSALWDSGFSRFNKTRPRLSFSQAKDKQFGVPVNESLSEENNTLLKEKSVSSDKWKRVESRDKLLNYTIEHFSKPLMFQSETCTKKAKVLMDTRKALTDETKTTDTIFKEANVEILKKHRVSFFNFNKKTESCEMFEKLSTPAA